MSDNDLGQVIDLPSTSAQADAPVEDAAALQQKAVEGHEKVLQLLDRNRTEGLKILEKRVLRAQDNDKLCKDSTAETRVRDLERGLGGSHTSLGALNTLFEYLRSDLINTIMQLEKVTSAQFQTGLHLQTLLELLQRKETITEDEMRATWQELMKGAGEAQPEEAEEAATEQ